MATYRTSFRGNPNIGLYAYCTDSLLLIAERLKKKEKEMLVNATKLKPKSVLIAGTTLIGVFLAGNSKNILVPYVVFEKELKVLDKLNVKYEVVKVIPTSLGNNIACNDNGAIVSTEFTKDEVKIIEKALGVKAVQFDIAETTTPGSVIVLNGEHGIIHNRASDAEIRKAEKILKVKLERATVNMGNPYLKSGIICNKSGMLVGGLSGGPEIAHLEESLGYLED